MDDQCVSETALVVPERFCNACGLSKPLEDFGFQNRDKGVRHSRCSCCLAQYYRANRLRQRRTELKEFLDKASDASNPQNYGATSRVEVVVRGMVSRFGGLDSFVRFWHEFILHSRASDKGHIVQHSLKHLLRFVELADRNHQTSGDASEDDTNKIVREYALNVLFEDPEMGVAALEGLGYRVERDESSEPASLGDDSPDVESRAGDATVESPPTS